MSTANKAFHTDAANSAAPVRFRRSRLRPLVGKTESQRTSLPLSRY
jgi:hypothetical protein